MKKVYKVLLCAIGVAAMSRLIARERRTIKNLRRNIDHLVKKNMV